MSLASHTSRFAAAGLDRRASQAAFACSLALPPALLHARAVADILLVAIGLLFLLHARLTRAAAWLRGPFALAAIAWWLWLCLCSAVGTGGLGMAIVAIRLPLLAVASGWALADAGRRRALLWVLAAAAGWIALQSWEQQITGTNLFGHGRYLDGALTGPFAKPRAGPALLLIFFPVVVPAVASLLARRALGWRLVALALTAFAVVTMVLIGQRMPTALMLLGAVVTALLLPRLRPAMLVACVCGALLLAAAPVISPGTYTKLVVQTTDQLRHFPQSAYGQLFVRATVMAGLHPWHGLGFDGFRRSCAEPAYAHGLPALGIAEPGGTEGCNIHPHNYYLEAADNAGLPGLALFASLAATLIWQLGRGLWRAPDALRVAVFATMVVAFWPLASTSAFCALPNAGWIFLVAGLGFASAEPARPSGREPGS